MVKTKNLLKTLSACAVVLALGGCGGSDDDGSIVACFTADRTVNFALTSSGLPSGFAPTNRSLVGPMSYGGRTVTGQTFFYPSGSTPLNTETNYWEVTSDGVTNIATIQNGTTVLPESYFLPQNMSPGQIVTSSNNSRYTFIGFETLNLAGKTFSNTCRINIVGARGGSGDGWYAPGYGLIKSVYSSGGTTQYNGEL